MLAQEFYQVGVTIVGIDLEYHMSPSQRTKDSVWKSIEKGGHHFFLCNNQLKMSVVYNSKHSLLCSQFCK